MQSRPANTPTNTPTNTSEKRYKTMTPEQFTQVCEAISQGRYSWACVLILRFVGHNPLHFIPYRTYSRLLKENLVKENRPLAQTDASTAPGRQLAMATTGSRHQEFAQIRDLTHLEPIDRQASDLRGGYFSPWWIGELRNCSPESMSGRLKNPLKNGCL